MGFKTDGRCSRNTTHSLLAGMGHMLKRLHDPPKALPLGVCWQATKDRIRPMNALKNFRFSALTCDALNESPLTCKVRMLLPKGDIVCCNAIPFFKRMAAFICGAQRATTVLSRHNHLSRLSTEDLVAPFETGGMIQ